MESQIRVIAEAAHDGTPITQAELFTSKHVKPILDKFIWKGEEGKANRRIVMTNKSRGERGRKLLVLSKQIPIYFGNSLHKKVYHIITVFEEFGNFVFWAYNPLTSSYKLRAEASTHDIYRWLRYHPSMLDKPPLLRPENFDKLVAYLVRVFLQ